MPVRPTKASSSHTAVHTAVMDVLIRTVRRRRIGADGRIPYTVRCEALHKVDYFVELCERYSLPSSGTKTARRDRLVKFSQAGMAKWKSAYVFFIVCVYAVLTDRITLHCSLFTPTRIPHKGVRNGGVTKRKPPKRVHRILQAGLLTTTTPPVIFATERSKDTHSQMVVDRILPWVCIFSCSLYLRMFTAVSGL